MHLTWKALIEALVLALRASSIAQDLAFPHNTGEFFNSILNDDVDDMSLIARGCYKFGADFKDGSIHGSHRQRYICFLKKVLALSAVDVNASPSFKDAFDNHKPTRGITPLCAASMSGSVEVVQVLLAHPNIQMNKTSLNTCTTPLREACRRGHDEVAKLLISQPSCDVNLADTRDKSPLMAAAVRGSIDVVKALLAHPDIQINQTAFFDQVTALREACDAGQVEVAKLLISEPSCDVNLADNDPQKGHSPLRIACGHTDLASIVEALLERRDINIEARTKREGRTPLHSCGIYNNTTAAQLLVLHGANAFAASHVGMNTASGYATHLGHHNLAACIDAIKHWSPLRVAAACRFHRQATNMLRAGTMDPHPSCYTAATNSTRTNKAVAAAIAEPEDFPWRGALPVCAATIKLVADAIRGWHQSTHWLHHANVRNAVFAVLVVADRLQIKDAFPPPASPHNPYKRHTRAVVAHLYATAPLPVLPMEMWFMILSFFMRSGWTVQN